MMDILTEADHKHDYGCVMLYFDFPKIKDIHDKIDKEDLYTEEKDDSYGIEKECHVTLLYGLHKGVTDEQIKDILDKITFGECKIENASIFENEKYDVLKFDVTYATRGGAFMAKANTALKKLPYTSDFPEFHPHMTIAYLKPHTGEHYVNLIKGKPYILTPKYATFSKPDGDKKKFKISVQK